VILRPSVPAFHSRLGRKSGNFLLFTAYSAIPGLVDFSVHCNVPLKAGAVRTDNGGRRRSPSSNYRNDVDQRRQRSRQAVQTGSAIPSSLEEFLWLRSRVKFCTEISSLQQGLDQTLHFYNNEPLHLGYRNQVRPLFTKLRFNSPARTAGNTSRKHTGPGVFFHGQDRVEGEEPGARKTSWFSAQAPGLEGDCCRSGRRDVRGGRAIA